MTGLTEADINRVMAGLALTGTSPFDPEQTLRIYAVLYDESDTRMLIESAKADIVSARSQLAEAKAEIESLICRLGVANNIIVRYDEIWEDSQ